MSKLRKGVFFICPGCGYLRVGDSNGSVCPNCGRRLISECPQCSTSITNPFARFCWSCGRPLRSEAARLDKGGGSGSYRAQKHEEPDSHSK